MDKNIGATAWSNVGPTSSGPVTVMDHLHNVTKKWTNIPNIVIDYEDEGKNYGTIKTEVIETKITKTDGTTTAIYENLKARLSELSGVSKFDGENLWMYNYLKNSDNVYGEGLQNIEGDSSYWILSSIVSSSYYASVIYYDGRISKIYISSAGGHRGVRPVIIIPKSNIY